MKTALKILLVFAVFSAFVPVGEVQELAAGTAAGHNCCGDSSPEGDSENKCSPVCHCSVTLNLPNSSTSGFQAEFKCIYYQSDTNKFIEEQTDPVFHPPIA